MLLALDHRETDRVPIALVCSGLNPPAYRAFAALLGRERGLSVEQYLDPLLDIRAVGPAYIGPPLPPGTDLWGVHRRAMSYGAGSYDEIDHHPLASATSIDDLLAWPWPSADWFDYAGFPDRLAAADADGERCLLVANGNIFESAWYLRGFEQMLLDLALAPEFAHVLCERVLAFHLAYFERALAAARGRIDLVFTADDIGGQQGLLLSLGMWERQLKPYHVRLNARIHAFGARVIYHSDGAVMDAVPGLLDMGIDVLQALQFDCAGMDPERLKREFGDRLCFQGGVSVQSTLPFGTVEQVRAEVRERIRVLGRGGGYILGPSHAIQAGTPPENVLAMFEEARRGPGV